MRLYFALGIAVVWAVSYVVSAATDRWTGFEVATPVMLVAATYLLAMDIHRRNGGSR